MNQHEEAVFWAHYGYAEKPVLYCSVCRELHEPLDNDKELSS